MAVSVPWITICGCGPGSVEQIPSAAHHAVRAAELVIGADRLLALFPHISCPRIPVQGAIASVLYRIEPYRGRPVAIVVTGDPGLCSIARHVVMRFGRHACTVIPAVSAIQVACAKLALDWTRAKVISYHGRIPDEDRSSVASHDPLIVLAGTTGAEAWTASLAEALGDRACVTCEDLTLPSESVRVIEPRELAQLESHPRRIIVLSQELRHGHI